jgi:isopenicillin N synthase-like dioxygenase
MYGVPTLDQVVAACRDPGVFRLKHDLLGTNLGKKAKLPGYFWGTPALSLRVKDLNWVEGLHLAPDNASADSPPDDDGGAYSAFRQAVTAEYVPHMARIARKLFDALAGDLALALDAEQRASYLEERGGTFRAYRYPACDPAAGRQHLGMEPHTDSSVLSILNMDLVGGLQVLVRDGPVSRWCAVRPVEGALVVNLGDMMQAMSGGAYRSVEHRVVAPPPGTERMSLCYFAFPQEDAVIVPSSTGKEERYRAFSYREFREQVQADIKATGAKVGLARFRIPDHPSPAPQ